MDHDDRPEGITIDGIKIYNERYNGNTSLIAALEEELMNLIRRVEETSKSRLADEQKKERIIDR